MYSSTKVAEAVAGFLIRNKWEAMANWADDIGPQQIKIEVGPKPNPYFDTTWVKNAKATISTSDAKTFDDLLGPAPPENKPFRAWQLAPLRPDKLPEVKP